MRCDPQTIHLGRIAIFLGLSAAVAGLGREAQAQYATSIPFNPWTAQYEAFVYPVVSSNLALPNQARMYYGFGSNSYNTYSRLDSFGDLSGGLNSLDLDFANANPELRNRVGATNGGRYVPYYSFYRLYDSDYNRRYVPNASVDKRDYEDRARREDLYLKVLSERDPQKRSELLRELDQVNRATRKELGYSRRRDLVPPTTSLAPVPPATAPSGAASRTAPAARPSATERTSSDLLFDPTASDPFGRATPDATRAPGLPPTSLPRPSREVGIGRPSYPRSAAPVPGSTIPAAPGLPGRAPGLDAPSRRRTPAPPSR